ncbi:PorP/SprF family type IX secretion system membrane protein [Reichenbachiella agariperforans]|uniref:PorP/SprF family type IX secretion system membrane protein n=1 Tax=Reichenbachiella agariperforans TaxID=156994 RepID=UPI001C08BD59|nr:PorP/SprF family type IX secretion system membrane protein [Reichenbachiella agariperforans]MBU2914771.1 PorP/SprF family type IX secretion system membrane protein [Reichenbachiella agariperforans]
MRKLIWLLGCFWLSTSIAFAQQDPVFSHFMLNASYVNPSLTTYDGQASVTLLSRNQWTGYEPTFEYEGGAPATQFVNFSTLLQLGKAPLALGGTFIYDEFGPRKDTYVQLSLAYHLEMSRGRLSLGVRPSVTNRVLDFAQLIAVDPSEFMGLGQESQMAPDLSAGMAYSSNDLMFALGVDHLIPSDFNYSFDPDGISGNEQVRVYSLLVRYQYYFSQKLRLEPTVMVKTNLSGVTYDVNVRAIYMEKMWGGVSYRDSEALTILLGYSFLKDNSLSVGYAFDYVVNDSESKQVTSHELYLRYNLPALNSREKKIVRTPRFRF